MRVAATSVWRTLLALCSIGVLVLYLWPFRFEFAPELRVNDAAPSDAPPGITFSGSGILLTPAPPVFLHEAIVGGDGLTIEAWAAPATLDQTGPARIITYSSGAGARNVTLGQVQDRLVVRLRTDQTDENALAHEIAVPGAFIAGRLSHIVVTYDFRQLRVYVDGLLLGGIRQPTGDFSTWDDAHRIALGNEVTGERPWRGTITRAALYPRALDTAEVLRNREAGGFPDGADTPLLAWDFADGLPERPGGALPTDLQRPAVFTEGRWPSFLAPVPRHPSDFAHGFVAFFAIGVLLAASLGTDRRRRFAVAAIAAATGALLAELAQGYVVGRTSALIDLAGALAGAAAGLFIGAGREPALTTPGETATEPTGRASRRTR